MESHHRLCMKAVTVLKRMMGLRVVKRDAMLLGFHIKHVQFYKQELKV
jgi:hypothetical protein